MNPTSILKRRYAEGKFGTPQPDLVAVEEPLEIQINHQPLSITMRTPGEDFDLVRGFLFTEQLIERSDDLLQLEALEENRINAQVNPKLLNEKNWQRNFYVSSSCGVCGKASIDQLQLKRPRVSSSFQIDAERISDLPIRMRNAQRLFEKTGGIHAAALFDSSGEILQLREDVGRHNAVDKVIGWALAEGRIPLIDTGLFVSGRTSFEILQKAASAGIPVVAAVSAPSSLAVSLAKEYGMTLIGFVRGETFNLYYDGGHLRQVDNK